MVGLVSGEGYAVLEGSEHKVYGPSVIVYTRRVEPVVMKGSNKHYGPDPVIQSLVAGGRSWIH